LEGSSHKEARSGGTAKKETLILQNAEHFAYRRLGQARSAVVRKAFAAILGN